MLRSMAEPRYTPGIGQAVDDPFGAPTDNARGTGAQKPTLAELCRLADVEINGGLGDGDNDADDLPGGAY